MKFTGIQSGDHECWCLLVTKEDFRAIRGDDPGEYDEGPFAEAGSIYRYKIYPHDIVGYKYEHKLLEIDIKVKEILPPKL